MVGACVRTDSNTVDGISHHQCIQTNTNTCISIGNTITVSGEGEARNWTLCLRNITQISGTKCGSYAGSELGVVVTPLGNEVVITL
ncbi:hypothetical protein N4Q71_04600 [Salmonella enterica subsp. enterica serovar Montevideo]